MLNEAWSAGDGERVEAIFRAGREAGQSQGNVGTGPGTPWGGPAAGSAGHSRDWAVDGAPTITGAQIRNFYNDVAQGRYEHRKEQKAALEQALQRSLNAGRVVD